MEEILKKIVDKRIKSIQEKGKNFGIDIPEKREIPIVLPDFEKGVVISEIKRGSPSEGIMDNIEDHIEWAGRYVKAGADAISILTEGDFFFGSLSDLIDIKERYPDMPVLRKDFLFDVEEIEISYLAGADMVLLITSVLLSLSGKNDISLLEKMKLKAESLGMIPVIEVHNIEELDKVLPIKPWVIGINSRDLNTFKINRGYPIGLKELIDRSSYTVYESGIRNKIDSYFVGSTGFNSILIGSSVIKSGDVIEKIKSIGSGFSNGKKNLSRFYSKIFKKIYIEKKIVVKICGITNAEDAKCSIEAGADIIGFIFAKSPRQIEIKKAKEISRELENNVLKVGVVADSNIEEAVKGVKEGWLDAIQFHGDIDNEKASSYNVCWYKAVRVKDKKDFDKEYFCPIVLYDAFDKEALGGTGKRIKKELLDHANNNNIDLYLAGGISPENVFSIINEYHPLMIDISSGVEKLPGKKDPEKIKRLFEEITRS